MLLRRISENVLLCFHLDKKRYLKISGSQEGGVFSPIYLKLDPGLGSVSSAGPVRASSSGCSEGNSDPVGRKDKATELSQSILCFPQDFWPVFPPSLPLLLSSSRLILYLAFGNAEFYKILD